MQDNTTTEQYLEPVKTAVETNIKKKTLHKGPNRAQRRRAAKLSRQMYGGFLRLVNGTRELQSALLELQQAPEKHLTKLAYYGYHQGLITAEAARMLGCRLNGVSGRKGCNH